LTNNTTLIELKEKMNQIIKDNPAKAQSKIDREIFMFEEELRELGLSFEVDANFNELDSSLGQHVFNSTHGFIGQDYCLKWTKNPQTSVWYLVVLNNKSNGQKGLIDCPDEMKVKLLSTFSVFASKIAGMLKD